MKYYLNYIIYPIISYSVLKLCKIYYNIFYLNILSIDMYDNTYTYKDTQTENILIAFNEIPT